MFNRLYLIQLEFSSNFKKSIHHQIQQWHENQILFRLSNLVDFINSLS